MNRIDRLTAILIQLQSKRIVTAKEIAERFDISVRTVYRDIRALEEAGVPIGAEAGLGYFLLEGYRLPPVQFTQDEAGSLLIGKKFVETMTDSATSENYLSAMMKIQAVLPHSEKDFIEQLQSTITIHHRKPFEKQRAPQTINKIQQAIAHSKNLTILYASKKGETTERIIEPIGLIHYMDYWHLIGYCQLRNNYRDFRSDRIQQINLGKNSFKPHNRLTLSQYIEQQKTQSPLIKVTLQIHSNNLGILDSSKQFFGFHSQVIEGSQWKLTFYTPELAHFARWIMSFTTAISNVSPPALIDHIHTHLDQAYKHYAFQHTHS
ncbi:MAG: YafY family transcriptional regulator [Fibrobacterales bacterium]